MQGEQAKKRNRWDDGTSDKVVKEEKRRRKQKQKIKSSSGPNDSKINDQNAKLATDTPSESSNNLGLPADMVLLSSRNSPSLVSSNSVDRYKRLNLIEEGSYGIVYRAEDLATGDIVALKKMKFDEKSPGFPVTSLREINALKDLNHPNILTCREVVVGPTHRE